MVKAKYVPERGNIVWINFSPHRGHEQAGRRPALVLSKRVFNERTGFILCCPITSQKKGYAFEVPFQSEKISGAILADQAHSFDWEVREIKFADTALREVVESVSSLVTQIARGA